MITVRQYRWAVAVLTRETETSDSLYHPRIVVPATTGMRARDKALETIPDAIEAQTLGRLVEVADGESDGPWDSDDALALVIVDPENH